MRIPHPCPRSVPSVAFEIVPMLVSVAPVLSFVIRHLTALLEKSACDKLASYAKDSVFLINSHPFAPVKLALSTDLAGPNGAEMNSLKWASWTLGGAVCAGLKHSSCLAASASCSPIFYLLPPV